MYTWCKEIAEHFSCRGALLDLPEVGLETVLPCPGAPSLQLALDANLGGKGVDPQDIGEFIPVGAMGKGEGLTRELTRWSGQIPTCNIYSLVQWNLSLRTFSIADPSLNRTKYMVPIVCNTFVPRLYKPHSIMRTVGCTLPATATRFGHFTFYHTAFSLISIVLVTSKVLGAFSLTHSKPELQKRGHVVLKSPSACCHDYRKCNQKLPKYGHLHIPDTHTWSQ